MNPFKPHGRNTPGTRTPPKLARVGDTIECDVRHPFQQTIRMKLETPAAAAHGNDLLMDPKSGWRLAVTPGVAPSAEMSTPQREMSTPAEMSAEMSIDPEPVAWLVTFPNEPDLGHYITEERPDSSLGVTPLYAHPCGVTPTQGGNDGR